MVAAAEAAVAAEEEDAEAEEVIRAVLVVPATFVAVAEAAASSLELLEGEEEDVEDSSPFDEVDEAAGGRVHVKKLVKITSGF